MSGQMWTPAPKRGVVPLHPFTFGTLLGRAFAILRHNPKVVFGFAVVVQTVMVLGSTAIMVAVLLTTVIRMQNVSPGSPDFEPLLVGTIALNAVVAFAIGLAAIGFTALVQGVVAAEVRFAAVGEKARLRTLWAQVKPAFWRLVGFSTLQIVATLGVIGIAAAIILGLMVGSGGSGDLIGVGILLVVLLVLAAIPLSIWLGTKLLLVPSILVFEHATLRAALVRSWRLTRGRFWVAFGVMFLIGAILGIAAQLVSFPLSLLSSLVLPLIAPTGAEDMATLIIAGVLATVIPQMFLLVIQAVALVVQGTGAAFVYLDSRYRYEGLDQALLAHLERRDEGRPPEHLGDPFAVDPARAVSSAPPPRQVPEYLMPPQTAPGYSPVPYPAQPYGQQPPQYGQPGYGQPGYGQQAPAYPPSAAPSAPYPPQAPPPAAAYPAPPTGMPHPPAAATPTPESPSVPAPPAPTPPVRTPSTDTSWAAPGGEG